MTAGTVHDPKTGANYRVLQAVVIILGVLIVLALAGIVLGMVLKVLGHKGAPNAVSLAAVSSQLPAGAKIVSLQTSGDRVIVAVHAPSGDEVDIFDAETGRFVARIRSAPSSVSK